MGDEELYKSFMKCWKNERDAERYTMYAAYYVPLHLYELEKSGKLKVGEKVITCVEVKEWMDSEPIETVWNYKG